MNSFFHSIQPLTLTDERFLWEMLYQALFVLPGGEPFPREIVGQPELRCYVESWGRAGDSGFIAIEQNERQPIGAVWIRLLIGENRGYGYVNDDTPELTIAVLPEYRGKGVGKNLLSKMLSHAQAYYRAICLSVSPNNPALHLYQRMGFETVKEESTSLTMVKNFD